MEPLNLPRGSVRALLVFALIVATVILGVFANQDAFTALVGILGVVVRDYFATRAAQNVQDGPPLGPPA